MMNGWKKEEVQKDDLLQKIRHVMKCWRVQFYTDRQALREISFILERDSNIQEKQNCPPFIQEPISSPNLETYAIWFDGGTPCNIPSLGYGIGYGSYKINDFPVAKCNFGAPMSANCAEITTLVYAIRNVLTLEPDRSKVSLNIWGGSTIAVNWANGINPTGRPCKVSKNSSEDFRNAVQTLRDILRGFGAVKASWHPRKESVKAFGH